MDVVICSTESKNKSLKRGQASCSAALYGDSFGRVQDGQPGFKPGTCISLVMTFPVAAIFGLWDKILAGHKNNLTLLLFLHRIPIKILLFEFAEGMKNGARVV